MKKNIYFLILVLFLQGCAILTPFAARSPHMDYQTKTDLQLPLEGEWYVYWGGMSIQENYHAVSSAQRFAIDFVKIKENEKPMKDPIRKNQTRSGKGKSIDSYYAYNQKILAPGRGIIYTVVDGLPDEHPGRRRSDKHFGNHVVIDHQNGEYSFLAHMKKNSIMVKNGDLVNKGDLIGLCGNSGMTTEPHLHYHMQNSPVPNKKKSGIPIYFNNYYANGLKKDRGFVKKGELVKQEL